MHRTVPIPYEPTMSDASIEPPPHKQIERIHIGGLNPVRLTGSEVAKRLESMEGLEIASIDALNDAKPFFYVNASSKTKGTTALELIVKQYHNVRWKGCKIIVQPAKPHFLERLVDERNQRAQRDEELAVLIDTYHNKNSESRSFHNAPKKIPRHMRIRQMYGTEAYHVDTKPCQVLDWRGFTNALLKMRSRRTKNTVEEENMHKVFMNRAVHLRFTHDELPEHTDEINESENDDRSERDEYVVTAKASIHESSYVWSDSDDDDEEEKVAIMTKSPRTRTIDTSVFAMALRDNEPEAYVPVHKELAEEPVAHLPENHIDNTSILGLVMQENETLACNDIDQSQSSQIDSRWQDDNGLDVAQKDKISNNHDDANEGESKQGVRAVQSNIHEHGKQPRKSFQWSSDDEVDNVQEKRPLQRTRKGLSVVDEFSAAVDFDRSSDDRSQSDNYDSGPEPFLAPRTPTLNLDEDVKSNLGVLSQLFPDMKVTLKEVDNTTGTAIIGAFPLFGSLGMQRYDPTKESSQIFEVESDELKHENTFQEEGPQDMDDEAHEGNKGTASNSPKSDDDECIDKCDDNVTLETNVGSEKSLLAVGVDVYEEKKLEHIFRAAREEGGNFQISSLFQSKVIENKASAEGAGTFSFGFDLAKTVEDIPKEDSVPFSSGLRTETTINELEADLERECTSIMSIDPENRIRRRGFHFPAEALRTYVEKFFQMNEGLYIAENPEGFRQDEEIKQQWKEERYTLTLDWKRKKKYAQSKMHKKMKFR